MSEKPYYAFGKLLTEGLNFVAWQEAQREHKKKNLVRIRAQVAGEVGYSSSAFSGWERGERLPEPKIIREVAKRFVKTKRVDQKWLQDFLIKGEYGSKQHIRALVDELFGNLQQDLIPLEFQSLVAEKTEGFVGRKHVFEAIAKFLTAEDNGYLIIQAVPGMGKTTLLAEYAKQKGCIVYFNRSGYGQDRSDQFLESICSQLIERYGLPYPAPPSHKDTQDGVFLNKLLNEIGPQLKPDKPLIIAVDALDEVDLTGHKAGQNILFLPPTLPNGVYFVLTQRPLKNLPFRVDTSRLFDLMSYKPQNRADAQSYIRRTVEQSPQLRNRLKGQGLEPAEFVSRLAKKSEDNFMYLRYVLPEIESGFYQTLEIEQLPDGLEQYYIDHWDRMGMTSSPLPRPKINIVYILTELRYPVSCSFIARRVKKDELTVQAVLNEWHQFLERRELEGEPCYSIYHTSFHDFLHRQDIVEKAGVSLKEINAQIVTPSWQMYRSYKDKEINQKH